jgi:transcription elongation factor Elf1
MGNWSTTIKGNDTTMDVYETFFDLYNEGQEASEVSAQVMEIFEDAFDDEDDRHAALFGPARLEFLL